MSSNLQQRMDELIASGSVAAVGYFLFFLYEINIWIFRHRRRLKKCLKERIIGVKK
jgi:hypothetical protein